MSAQFQRVQFSLGGGFTPMVRLLMWINGLLYLAYVVAKAKDPAMAMQFQIILGLNPDAVWNKWAIWQPITYMFLHGSFLHLLFNMLGLWWFGSDVERLWGSRPFLRYYFLCGLGAAITCIIFDTPLTVGASGAIYGLLLAFGLLFPNRLIYLYFVIPVKAKYCVLIFGLIEVISLTQTGSGVNHLAHLGGLAFGLPWFFLRGRGWNLPGLWKRMKQRRMRKKLRLIQKNEEERSGYTNETIH